MSNVTVAKEVWKNWVLQPRRLNAFISTDPESEVKVRNVLGLCVNPPDHAVGLYEIGKS